MQGFSLFAENSEIPRTEVPKSPITTMTDSEKKARRAALLARSNSTLSLNNSAKIQQQSSQSKLLLPEISPEISSHPSATDQRLMRRRFSETSQYSSSNAALNDIQRQRRNSEIGEEVVSLRCKIRSMANRFALSDTTTEFAKKHIPLR